MKIQLIATTTFGLEAVVKREIQDLGYTIIKAEDGKVTYEADERGIVRSNLWIRSAERILLKMGEFRAMDFEALFQRTKGIAWENLIPMDGKFTVNGSSVKSRLHSVPACQSTVKKAVVERLGDFYSIDQFEETGAEYTIKVTLLKDEVTLTVDTSGKGLHKRGYRVKDVQAPIKETLAAALVQLSFYKPGRTMIDPCCGSGTIPIECAMIQKNIAPGLNRDFASCHWELIPAHMWKEERKAAFDAIKKVENPLIFGGDIDNGAIMAARENAMEAGVDDAIVFYRDSTVNLEERKEKLENKEEGMIITNPPYGERIGEKKEIETIYRSLNTFMKENQTWSVFVITTDKNTEVKVAERRAERRRKLYNGRLETCYYQFHGTKKPKQ